MFVATTHQALRWTFLGSGMSHANFLATADRVHPGAAAQLKAVDRPSAEFDSRRNLKTGENDNDVMAPMKPAPSTASTWTR